MDDDHRDRALGRMEKALEIEFMSKYALAIK
jgi:hypothetical protein